MFYQFYYTTNFYFRFTNFYILHRFINPLSARCENISESEPQVGGIEKL